jgi:amino acid adenylation domain-containing protein
MSTKSYEAIYPLSPSQQGMLFETLVAPESGIHIEQIVFDLHGRLDFPAFERAWQEVVKRHAILRTVFVWQEQEEPLQVVLEGVEVPLVRHDWRHLPASEQRRLLDAYLQADGRQGFEVSKPPLMRLALFQIAETDYKLVWSYHHILMDGWCRPIVFNELLAFYHAHSQGRTLQLENTRPYKDYIAWLKQQDLARAETFWRRTLQGFTEPTPLGAPAAPLQLGESEELYGGYKVPLAAEATNALRSLARQHQLTLNTLVQGVWALLLHRYGGACEVVFGVTVSGRPPNETGFDSTIGMFINTLPVRVEVSPSASLWPWLREIQSRNFTLRQYEYSPASLIHQWSEIPGTQPLYESLIVFENYPVNQSPVESDTNIAITNVHTRGARTKYAATLLATLGAELWLQLIYDRRRLDDASGRHIIDHLLTLLNSIAAQPERQLSTLLDQIPQDEIPRVRPLQEREQQRSQGEFVAPRNQIEEILAGIWSDVLGVKEISVEDNFFELGGHSLLATQLIALLRDAFRLPLPLGALFQSPTVSGLSQEIARLRQDSEESASLSTTSSFDSLPKIVADREQRYEPFPLTDIQQAYWVGRSSSLELGGVATHIYFEVEGTGLDLTRLERAWRRVITRHDMLRAIVLADGRQQVLESVPPYEIEVTDLRGMDEERAGEELAAVRARMSHQVIPADRWPLFEIRASRLTDERLRLHVSFDMLIGDAWSVQLLLRDLMAYYLDEAAQLPELEVTFRDYVLTEASLRETPLYEEARRYWWNRIDEMPAAPELPLARNPATLEQPQFSRRTARLEAPQWEELKRRARQAGLTPSGVLLAAYAEVLSLWSKRQHFMINLTLFNRLPLHEQIAQVVGDFTSLTLLEADYRGGGSFRERGRKLQEQLWEDIDRRYVSGVAVMRELARRRGAAQAVMPVIFTSILNQAQTRGSAGQTAAGESAPQEQSGDVPSIEAVYNIGQTPQVWLDLQVSERESGELICYWDAVDELFPPDVLQQMFDTYCSLLERLAEDEECWDDARLLELPPTQAARRAAYNDTYAPLSDSLLHTLFLRQAEQQPDQQALISRRARFTYGELERLTRKLAQRLRLQGVQANQLVAVVMEKGWEQTAAVLSVLRAGAAYLPISADLPRERIDYLLGHGEVKVLLTQPWIDERFEWPQGIQRIQVTQSDEAQEDEADAATLDELQSDEDLAYVIYTSGSTGTPKGVMIDHRGAVNTILDINERFHISPSDRVLALSSLSFDLSVYDIFGTLAAGATVVIPDATPSPDPAHWAEMVAQHGVTVWNTVPALMQMLVEYVGEERRGVLESLRLVMLSGDWIGLSLPDEIRKQSPRAHVVSLGGATEASIWSILYEIGEVRGEWKSIPYGHPMRNQQIYVLNERMEECPEWVTGQLYIGGVGLARGYWRDEERTARSFVEHERWGERLYRTGDVGRQVESGEVEFLGREDYQVKVQGHRIELGEVEAALSSYEKVKAAVVSAVGERQGSKSLVAYVVVEREGARNGEGEAGAASNGGAAESRQEARDAEELLSGWERLQFKLSHPGLRAGNGQPSVQLVRPELDERLLELYYAQRRSYRKMLRRPLKLEQLGEFLSCLLQLDIEGLAFPKSRYGSAGSLYPVQTYLYVKPERVEGLEGGVYYYHPTEHRLVLLTPDARIDQSYYSAVNHAVVAESAFSIFLVGQMKAITPMYGEAGRHYAAIEAGLMTQLMEMSAPASQIGLCQIGSVAFESIRHLFKLEESHVLLHSLVGGAIETAQTRLPALLREANEAQAAEALEGERAPDDEGAAPSGVAQTDEQIVSGLKGFLREKLPAYMIPSTFVLLDALPLSSNGKVNRNALPQPDALHAASTQTYIAPDTEVEQTIAAIVEDVLQIEKVSVEHNFFDIGGTSVHMIRVYNKLREAFGKDFPLVVIFENPTIASLAKYLAGAEDDGDAPQKDVARGEKRKAAALQKQRRREKK